MTDKPIYPTSDLTEMLTLAQTKSALGLCPRCGGITDEDHTTGSWADGTDVRGYPWICLRCAESRQPKHAPPLPASFDPFSFREC